MISGIRDRVRPENGKYVFNGKKTIRLNYIESKRSREIFDGATHILSVGEISDEGIVTDFRLIGLICNQDRAPVKR